MISSLMSIEIILQEHPLFGQIKLMMGMGVSQSGVRLDMIIPAAVQVQYLAGQWRRSGVLLVLRLD